MEFGAFVELEPGLEGLVHVSQLAKERVRNPRDVVKPGQKLTVRVVSVEPARARIALSRMDPRGALIGSEDSVDTNVIDEAMRAAAPKPMGTNLGNLFKKALKPPPGS
jgi:transcriptional accessory protein Tex/SPT6